MTRTPTMRLLEFLRHSMAIALLGAGLTSAHAGLREGLEATRAKDYQRGFREFMFAGMAGSPLAQRYVGMYYGFGMGRPQHDEYAKEWYERAVKGNDADAKAHLGDYYLQTAQRSPIICLKGLDLVTQAANQGSARAYLLLADHYRSDTCGRPETAKAVKWSQKAAELGHPVEADVLGKLYWKGRGAWYDVDEAIKWFTVSASQGRSMAMVSLGQIFLGSGRPRDLVSAVTWFRLGQQAGIPGDERWGLKDIIATSEEELAKDPAQALEVDRRVAAFKPSAQWKEYVEKLWQAEFDEADRWDKAHAPKSP